MHDGVYRRVDAIAKVGDSQRLLDRADPNVREAVAQVNDAKSLYEGYFAIDY